MPSCVSLLGKPGCLQTMSVGLQAGRAVTRSHGWGCKRVRSVVFVLEALMFSYMPVSSNHLCQETVLSI